MAETTLGRLLEALEDDLVLKSRVKKPDRLLDRALLWLHEQEVIRLHKGLAVFRPAMTIELAQETPRRGFANVDFEPLKLHYQGQVQQIHVMVEYARRGLEAMADALHLTMDYFSLKQGDFLGRWLPDRHKEIERQTTPESWRAIVESLHNPAQQRIVADDREHTNVPVLAGPGSGKTRVLVHRIAYLVRARRENPRGILAGASVEFIRRFEADYGPMPAFLTANYRSTGHIIAAANALIEPARDRMKTGHPIRIDRARAKDPPGGDWRELDPVAQGRVQILPVQSDLIAQAHGAMTELARLSGLASSWDWSKCAVIAREWRHLEPVRACASCVLGATSFAPAGHCGQPLGVRAPVRQCVA